MATVPRLITRTVLMLSVISLFTDVATEMLYPVLPSFLVSIGFNVVLIGILEGMAEATAGLTKGYFGNLSDRWGRRLPFVRLGYLMSAAAKPLMVVSALPIWIFFARTLDRFGKGVRTGARDAMLAGESQPSTRGRVFGFHRAMDTAGAILGPVLAMTFLHFYPGQYATLFLLTIVPGVGAICISLFLDEGRTKMEPRVYKQPWLGFIHYWKQASPQYKKLVAGLTIFALINSSDMFLLLRVKLSGHSDIQVIQLYVLYNLSYALLSFPAGWLADRVGVRFMWMTGLMIFAMVYGSMAFVGSFAGFVMLFILYGGFAACSEGLAKAWISLECSSGDTGSAIGTYAGFQSLAALASSTIAGVVWTLFGGDVLFTMTAFLTVMLLFYFLRIRNPYTPKG